MIRFNVIIIALVALAALIGVGVWLGAIEEWRWLAGYVGLVSLIGFGFYKILANLNIQ